MGGLRKLQKFGAWTGELRRRRRRKAKIDVARRAERAGDGLVGADVGGVVACMMTDG